MKKWLLCIGMLFISGCSQPMDSVSETLPSGQLKQEKQYITTDLTIYSLDQSSEASIIKWDERDKWAIVDASVIVKHPNALIETSAGQLLEGTVSYINTEDNFALVHFRNSAFLDQDIKLDEIVAQFNRKDNRSDRAELKIADLQLLIDQNFKKSVPFEERIAAREALQNIPVQKVEGENKIAEHSKATFLFDRDKVEAFSRQFIAHFNDFVTKKEVDLNAYVSNDLLRQMFDEWEVFDGTYEIIDYDVTTIQLNDFLYEVTLVGKLGKDQQQEASVLIQFIQQNNTYKVVSLKINK